MTRFPIRILAIAVAAWCCAAARPHVRADAALATDVTAQSASHTAFQLSRALARGKERLVLRINSPGGSISDGFKLVAAVEDLRHAKPSMRILCFVDGEAGSMAAVILESSACDYRVATPTTRLVFHNGSNGEDLIGAQVEQLIAHAIILERSNALMALVVSTRLGMPYDVYRSHIAGKDWELNASQALTVGALDAIATVSELPKLAGR